jgi:hypothetical protein
VEYLVWPPPPPEKLLFMFLDGKAIPLCFIPNIINI